MLIDLIYPASSTGSDNYSSEPPLGPIALFSSLPEIYRQNVRFLDSTIMSQLEIEEAVKERKADIIALSCTTYNYSNALRIAEIAKSNGAFVVCGGIHITHRRDAILHKMQKGERPFDFLVTGYGEPVFSALITALIKDLSLAEIPNISYVKEGQAIINHLDNRSRGADPLTKPLDYSKIDFAKYSSYFKPQGNLSDVKMVGSTYTQRGCAYTGQKKCTFCSIEHLNLWRSSELFEQDLFSLTTKYNIDHVRISDADFTVNIKHMNRITDAANNVFDRSGVRPAFHCFARADEINHKTASILQRLNAVSLMVGYESGSDRMLKAMNKHVTKKQNLLAAELLKDYGIEVIAGGLVLGVEGEDETTLSETIDFVNDLKAINNTRTMMATPLIPLPGSLCFNQLLDILKQDDLPTFMKLNDEDNFNLEELIELWNYYFCKVSLSRLVEVGEQVEKILPIGIRLIDMQKHHCGNIY
ncbi:MAG: B12-binding domain-containing radical SAM protein [Dysgonamonadaceae bacterium]|jgi:radical SAM superfamily enzyme YgiQ (UPF0313 family)|nr:B12-binding domain-containing radical SAM protein [Dysgonamonadaceae bacterium]